MSVNLYTVSVPARAAAPSYTYVIALPSRECSVITPALLGVALVDAPHHADAEVRLLSENVELK